MQRCMNCSCLYKHHRIECVSMLPDISGDVTVMIMKFLHAGLCCKLVSLTRVQARVSPPSQISRGKNAERVSPPAAPARL